MAPAGCTPINDNHPYAAPDGVGITAGSLNLLLALATDVTK